MNIHKRKSTWLVLALLLGGLTIWAAAPQPEETVTCPVCCKEMKKSAAKISLEYKGETFYFASAACRKAFTKEPEKYVKTVYTCPMHPEIKADEKGKCPECGMFLEARTVARNCVGKQESKTENAAGTAPAH
jgi:YHS domain-containing protein